MLGSEEGGGRKRRTSGRDAEGEAGVAFLAVLFLTEPDLAPRAAPGTFGSEERGGRKGGESLKIT